MRIIRYLPDAVTSMNLLCGILGVAAAFSGNIDTAFILMLAAAVFDFCDGFCARALDAYSDFGKELDSLSDMVSFGVLPSMMMYVMMTGLFGRGAICSVPLIIAVFSGLRLAKFNVDSRQSESFLGLATPACAMICGSLCCCLLHHPQSLLSSLAEWKFFIPALSVALSAMLVCELPMFSMKIKKGAPRSETLKRIVFLALSALAAVSVLLCGAYWAAVVLCVFVIYILMNIVCAILPKRL